MFFDLLKITLKSIVVPARSQHIVSMALSCAAKYIPSLVVIQLFFLTAIGQPDSSQLTTGVDTALQGRLVSLIPNSQYQLNLSPEIKRKRIIINTAAHAGLYAGSMLVLNQAWYADPRSEFHTFNDNAEWLQVDKVGHAWSAYQISRVSMATWKWAGLNRKQQIWIGGLAGATFQTVIEVLDGYSAEWGWSWGDFAANCFGSGLLIGQQLAWNDQRISFKYSFHKMNYDNPVLNDRSDELFGSSLPERALKDYNGQTYWLSANLKSFMPRSRMPAWLNVAVGYGGNGMFGAFDNEWIDDNGVAHNLSGIPRKREWYLAPDIDFTKIPTNKKWLKTVFFILNGFKMPSPALVLSNGKIKIQGFYF